ncbi:MAG: acetylxylan esterase [Candidatus Firestonebacteria bacterium]
MASIDMPLEKLRKYKPILTGKKDFSLFWKNTINEARKYPVNPELKLVKDSPFKYMEAYDLTFAGFNGDKIKGWYLLPKFVKKEKLPVVVIYHGYSGGRGQIADYSQWILLGCAVAVMDTRGQGGATGNMLGYSNPSVGGWMTKGILDKNEYYYRAVYTDAVRILDFVFEQPEIDKTCVAITGGSQGGGITIAAAGLDKRITIAIPIIPFLCHFKRAVEISPNGPYVEVAEYIKRYPHYIDKVYDTLSYFDGMNFAANIKARSLWSVTLWDDICPPSTVFAAYNNVKTKKEIRVYPYNKHEGIPWFDAEKFRVIAQCFKLKNNNH